MNYVFLGALALLAALAAFNYLRKLDQRVLMRGLRWVIGGLGALIAVLLLLARRIDLAIFVGAGAFAVLRTGRIGAFSFDRPSKIGRAHV